MRYELPHLHEIKDYVWSKQFRESRNKINLLTAANQCGKSVSLVRKNIEWACNKKLWPELWPMNPNPRQFWYFYPSAEMCLTEFEKKWVPDILPRGKTRLGDENYGWEDERHGGELTAIHFKSGVSLYFKTYGQKASNLQAATLHMVSGDEEMPEELVDELMSRLSATGGYFNLVFTATLGLPLWYRAMECQGKSDEAFKKAEKWQVSLYDCQTFIDGTRGHWPIERIKEREASCTTHNEILRRVMGRFVREEGRKYGVFSPTLCRPATVLPADWKIYGGVDVGSGGLGRTRSKGAITIIAAAPDFTKGRVIKTWRGDHVDTTAQDILHKFRELTKGLPLTNACYDHQSREFGLIAARSGMPFVMADKARAHGEQTLNALFGAGTMTIDEGVYDNEKLVTELMSIPAGEKKRGYIDDLADSFRYCSQLIPWDFPKMGVMPEGDGDPPEVFEDHDFRAPPVHLSQAEYQAWEIRQRRGDMGNQRKEGWDEYYDDIAEANELNGND